MKKSYDYYISKGLTPKYAKYFSEGIKKISSVKPNDDYTLTLEFDNTEVRIFDVKPLLKTNTVFEPFINLDNFKRVYLDETKNVSWDINPNIDSNEIWSNKVDLCSDTCYVESIPMD